MALNISTKRVQIDKASLNILVAVSIAAFLLVFALVSSKALLAQRAYQSAVIEKKQKALDNLESNIKVAEQLTASYQAFVSTPDNLIGGTPTGTSDRDGDNARLVLDALPSKYDFPALATSLDKILTSQNFKIESIAGVDDEINQSKNPEAGTPVAVDIPFQVIVLADPTSLPGLLTTFERSIRPIQIQSLTISGTNNELNVSIVASTYYQPEKTLQIKSEVVKQK